MIPSISSIEKAMGRLDFKFPYTIQEWIKKNFVIENYHKHTTWSNLVTIDSATSIEDFITLLKDRDCQFYFSGEHGYPGEWLYCYDLCKKMNIGFRYSMEVYWVKDINYEREEKVINKKGQTEVKKYKDKTNCHMVLIARNYNAIRKLNYLTSIAHTDGFYGRPRIDLKMLFTLSPEDVYVSSACTSGWNYEDAAEIWYSVWKHFGDSFFLEYQTHNTDKQKELNKRIYEMSKAFGIKTIVGLDTHYINELDRVKRDKLLLRKGIHYEDEDGWYMDFPDGVQTIERLRDQKVLSDEEILYAMMNTFTFTNGCEDFEYDNRFKIPIIQKYNKMTYEQRCEELHKFLWGQYEKEEIKSKEREEGLEYEFGQIRDSGTADYFLTNHEVIDLGVHKYGGQLTTTSRGSASSYYGSKLCGFTTMDRFEAEVPIYPERFITKDRILSSNQMPDIDINCSCQEPFVAASRELCGEYGCYPLLAVGTFGEKSGFKMYADTEGIDPQTANEITSKIDEYNEAVKQAEDDEKDSIRIEDYITDENHLKIFMASKSYQGIIEQAKCHPCGHCIFNGNPNQTDVPGYGDLRYEFGLIRCASKNGNVHIVLNCEGKLLDTYGYVKDDFLIVDVVSIIWKLYHTMGREVPTVSELRKMVADDKPTWDLYANGITCCLNQCEKKGTKGRVKVYKPQNVKELAAFIAGIRPGFKSHINDLIHRIPYSNGEPVIDDLLKDCFCFMLYQEAVMKIFSYLGIPMKDSYDTIKKIAKKKLKGEALQHVEDTLRKHWVKEIGNLDNFEPVYKVIKDSARYSFNAPHALAMAFDSLYEAWMKAHYPSIFYEVTLNHYQEKEDKDKVAELMKEAKECFGYKIGTYQYGVDNSKFTVDDEKKIIYPNLGSVKGIGKKVVKSIYEISLTGTVDIADVYIRSSGLVSASIMRDLAKIGYFDNICNDKQAVEIFDLIDAWDDKKTLSKKDEKALGIDGSKYGTDLLKSGKHSDSRYTNLDWKALAKDLAKRVPPDKYTVPEKVKFQYEILGYVDYKDPSLSDRLIVVTNLDLKFSPRFTAYRLKDGKNCELKVSNSRPKKEKDKKGNIKPEYKNETYFEEIPFEDGDVLCMMEAKKKPKQRKTDDGWEIIPGEFNWWITSYQKA